MVEDGSWPPLVLELDLAMNMAFRVREHPMNETVAACRPLCIMTNKFNSDLGCETAAMLHNIGRSAGSDRQRPCVPIHRMPGSMGGNAIKIFSR